MRISARLVVSEHFHEFNVVHPHNKEGSGILPPLLDVDQEGTVEIEMARFEYTTRGRSDTSFGFQFHAGATQCEIDGLYCIKDKTVLVPLIGKWLVQQFFKVVCKIEGDIRGNQFVLTLEFAQRGVVVREFLILCDFLFNGYDSLSERATPFGAGQGDLVGVGVLANVNGKFTVLLEHAELTV